MLHRHCHKIQQEMQTKKSKKWETTAEINLQRLEDEYFLKGVYWSEKVTKLWTFSLAPPLLSIYTHT